MEIIVRDKKTGKIKTHFGRKRIRSADGSITNQEINPITGRWRKKAPKPKKNSSTRRVK